MSSPTRPPTHSLLFACPLTACLLHPFIARVFCCALVDRVRLDWARSCSVTGWTACVVCAYSCVVCVHVCVCVPAQQDLKGLQWCCSNGDLEAAKQAIEVKVTSPSTPIPLFFFLTIIAVIACGARSPHALPMP
jgi:hypothetical protein